MIRLLSFICLFTLIVACASPAYVVHFTMTQDICGGAAPVSEKREVRASTTGRSLYLLVNDTKTKIVTDESGVYKVTDIKKGDTISFFLPDRIETPIEENDALCERFRTTPDHQFFVKSRKVFQDSVHLHLPCNPCLLPEPNGPPMPQN